MRGRLAVPISELEHEAHALRDQGGATVDLGGAVSPVRTGRLDRVVEGLAAGALDDALHGDAAVGGDGEIDEDDALDVPAARVARIGRRRRIDFGRVAVAHARAVSLAFTAAGAAARSTQAADTGVFGVA